MAEVPPSDIFTRRVCLQLDGMDAVTVRRDVAYGQADSHCRFDLYDPPGPTDDGPAVAKPAEDLRWPAVIIVAGYPETVKPGAVRRSYKDIGWTVSMCQLIALSGMVAIAYTNRDPVADLRALLEYLDEHAESLTIDPARVGVVAVSGSVPTALSTIMQDAGRPPACAVFGYGCLLDFDGATDVADAARQFGFANPGTGRSFGDLRRDVPLRIIRAGRDQFPAMNASIDRFIRQGLIENVPMTFVNHAEGAHAFDLFEDSPPSRDIVRETLRFLQRHLTARSDENAPVSSSAGTRRSARA